MSRKSTQIALGGVFSSLCLLLLFMTGLIPFATYAVPMLAGAMLIPVVLENGKKTAVLVYVSASLLSLFIVVDKEAAMMFVVFFGYYPIVKPFFESLRLRAAEYLGKLLLFNSMVVGGYLAVLYVLGMPDLIGSFGDFGQYSALILLGAGNLIFLAYDRFLTQFVTAYVNWFKPRFLRR